METKHIFFMDRVWWDADGKRIIGDMGFTFCDSTDTRTEDLLELQDNANAWINAEESIDERGDYDKDFALYELHEAELELEDLSDPLWSGYIETDKVKSVYACAHEEEAKRCKLGDIHGPDVELIYMTACAK